jgi:hypothetical protein
MSTPKTLPMATSLVTYLAKHASGDKSDPDQFMKNDPLVADWSIQTILAQIKKPALWDRLIFNDYLTCGVLPRYELSADNSSAYIRTQKRAIKRIDDLEEMLVPMQDFNASRITPSWDDMLDKDLGMSHFMIECFDQLSKEMDKSFLHVLRRVSDSNPALSVRTVSNLLSAIDAANAILTPQLVHKGVFWNSLHLSPTLTEHLNSPPKMPVIIGDILANMLLDERQKDVEIFSKEQRQRTGILGEYKGSPIYHVEDHQTMAPWDAFVIMDMIRLGVLVFSEDFSAKPVINDDGEKKGFDTGRGLWMWTNNGLAVFSNSVVKVEMLEE